MGDAGIARWPQPAALLVGKGYLAPLLPAAALAVLPAPRASLAGGTGWMQEALGCCSSSCGAGGGSSAWQHSALGNQGELSVTIRRASTSLTRLGWHPWPGSPKNSQTLKERVVQSDFLVYFSFSFQAEGGKRWKGPNPGSSYLAIYLFFFKYIFSY